MTVTKPKQTATLFIVALLLAILAGSPPQSDAATRLVLTTSLPITELSFDDSRVRAARTASACGSSNSFSVHRRSFVTRHATRLVNPRCVVTSTGYFGRLVLAGARVYWAQSQGGNSSRTWSIWTTPAPGQATKLLERAVDCGAACSCSPPALGTDLGNTDGAGSTFLFTSRDMAPSPTCPPGGDEGIVTASRLTRVTAGPSGLVMGDVPGAPGGVGSTNAYAAGRVALVPLENGEPPNHDPGRVEIRDVATGALVSQFTPAAPVRAVTLSQSVAAVVTKMRGSARIETYDVQTGLCSTPGRRGTRSSRAWTSRAKGSSTAWARRSGSFASIPAARASCIEPRARRSSASARLRSRAIASSGTSNARDTAASTS